MSTSDNIELGAVVISGVAFLVSAGFSILASVIARRSAVAAEHAATAAAESADEAKRSADAAFQGVEQAKRSADAAAEGVEQAKRSVDAALEGVEQARRSADAAIEGLKHAAETVTVAREQLDIAREEKNKADAPQFDVGKIIEATQGGWFVPITMRSGPTSDVLIDISGRVFQKWYGDEPHEIGVQGFDVPLPGAWELPECSEGKYQELMFVDETYTEILALDVKITASAKEVDPPEEDAREWTFYSWDRHWTSGEEYQ